MIEANLARAFNCLGEDGDWSHIACDPTKEIKSYYFIVFIGNHMHDPRYLSIWVSHPHYITVASGSFSGHQWHHQTLIELTLHINLLMASNLNSEN